jgi:ribosomal protein L32
METTSTFLGLWQQYMFVAAVACVAFGAAILVYHEYRVSKIKNLKDKYDYVNENEIKYKWYAVLALIVAAAFYANTLATGKIESDGMRWFYVRLFITASFAVIGYIVCYSLVRIYYPRQVEKRLTTLRNAPRTSAEGNLMRKLSEAEEEHHLEEEMRRQGEIHSIDYDVWVDEKTGSMKVEKYPAYRHAEECSECGFYTLRIDSEEVEQEPTSDDGGILLTHYACTYCGHREQREVVVAKLSANVV